MARTKTVSRLRPAVRLGEHTNDPVKVAIDEFLRRWGEHGIKTRDRLLAIPKSVRDAATEGTINYWNNYVSTVEQLRYQNCRRIASRNVNKLGNGQCRSESSRNSASDCSAEVGSDSSQSKVSDNRTSPQSEGKS